MLLDGLRMNSTLSFPYVFEMMLVSFKGSFAISFSTFWEMTLSISLREASILKCVAVGWTLKAVNNSVKVISEMTRSVSN